MRRWVSDEEHTFRQFYNPNFLGGGVYVFFIYFFDWFYVITYLNGHFKIFVSFFFKVRWAVTSYLKLRIWVKKSYRRCSPNVLPTMNCVLITVIKKSGYLIKKERSDVNTWLYNTLYTFIRVIFANMITKCLFFR